MPNIKELLSALHDECATLVERLQTLTVRDTDLSAKVITLENDLKTLRENHQTDIQRMMDIADREVAVMKESTTRQVKDITESSAREIAQLRDSHQKELNALRQAHEQEINALKTEHRETTRSLESELWNFKKVSQLVAFEKENATLRQELERLSKFVESHKATQPSPAANATPPPYEGYQKSGHQISGANLAPMAQEIAQVAQALPKRGGGRKKKAVIETPSPPTTDLDKVDIEVNEFAASVEAAEMIAEVVNEALTPASFDDVEIANTVVEESEVQPPPHESEPTEDVEQIIATIMTDDPATVTDDPATVTDDPAEDEVAVYEKKIQGKIYYVDDANNIYAIEDDGGVGDIIGTWAKLNGKVIPTWK